MPKITLTTRGTDVMAVLDGDPRKWDCGRGRAEAIGALVLSWPEAFGITIVDETRPQPAPAASFPGYGTTGTATLGEVEPDAE